MCRWTAGNEQLGQRGQHILVAERKNNTLVSLDWLNRRTVDERQVSRYPELLGMLPGGLGEGQVTIAGSRTWEDSGRDNALSFVMNAETSRMVAWYHTSLPTD